jgi:hypothetical protein
MDKKIIYTDFGQHSYLSYFVDYDSNKVFINYKLRNKAIKDSLSLTFLSNRECRSCHQE